MLVVFGGLPGVRKTTLSRALAARLGAVWLRIDTIEQAMVRGGMPEGQMGPAGYCVAQAVAAANLALGHAVVADSVNPVEATRAAWRAVAAEAGVALLEVEVVCSDPAEHRRRVESRVADIPGMLLPDWAAVTGRHYEPWAGPLRLDTAQLSLEAALARLEAEIAARRA